MAMAINPCLLWSPFFVVISNHTVMVGMKIVYIYCKQGKLSVASQLAAV